MSLNSKINSIYLGSEKIVEILLKNGADANHENLIGTTAIIGAFKLDNITNMENIIELLLSHGANLNWQNTLGETPLIDAIRNGILNFSF